MKDKEGRAITPLVENAYRPLVITAEAEDFFFGGQSAIGRQISENDDLSEPSRSPLSFLPSVAMTSTAGELRFHDIER